MTDRGTPPRLALIIGACTILAAIGFAWAFEAIITDDAETSKVSASSYSVVVVHGGVTLHRFTRDDLEALPQRSFKQNGKIEKGPTLVTVLREAGVESFTALEVVGMGLRDSGRGEFTASQLEDAILDLANRGTAKLCGPRIDWHERVRDVTALRVH